MREVKIETFCDLCWQGAGVRTPASVTLTVAVEEGENTRPVLRLVEVCTEHAAPFESLRSLTEGCEVIEAAPAPKPPPTKGGSGKRKGGAAVLPTSTPAFSLPTDMILTCPVCQVARGTVGTMRQHFTNVHDAPSSSSGRSCPDCGFKAKEPQGLGAHRRTKHGVDAFQTNLAAVPESEWRRYGTTRPSSWPWNPLAEPDEPRTLMSVS